MGDAQPVCWMEVHLLVSGFPLIPSSIGFILGNLLLKNDVKN